MRRRVVITGMGTVNALGHSIEEFWDALSRGRSGVARITKFDPQHFQTQVAAEIKGFVPTDRLDRREARKMDPFSQYAVAASVEAMSNAGLDQGRGYDPERTGVTLGCGIGGFETLGEAHRKLFFEGPHRIMPMAIPKLIGNIGPGNIAIHFNCQGPCLSTVTACASGSDAIGNAYHWIQRGVVDAMIAGGAEACITELGVGGFNVIQALSTAHNATPERASRPFDRDRDGFVLGEGAGILAIEELEHARSRDAVILAEIIGYGSTCDADHLTAPHPEGRGAAQAMHQALRDAEIRPEEVHYINAHGTGTQLNDKIETNAIKSVFGEHAWRLKISSTKSMTGHCIGATGAMEIIACTLAMQNSYIPPTINLENPDPECDLDYVPNCGVTADIETAMSNSFGFGGHNSTVLLRRYRN